MCGIAGIYSTNNSFISADTVKHMLSRIRHRGPDESGVYVANQIALGSVRLSIIDISSGQQPMSDIDKNFWIVFNGEIFNYIELREELVDLGYKFKTNSDTEVIINLYKHFGASCVNKLNGQFAFAIWEKQKQELFLARDRVGIRPLFYTFYQGAFIFGSEIKTFLDIPGLKLEMDHQVLSQFYTFWTAISPRTIFKNVYEVPPGHTMRIKNSKHSLKKYWGLNFPEKGETTNISLSEAKETLDDLFKDSIKLRLRADVQVAAYLSGGLDSSTTTYYIKNTFPEILETFSIGFEDKEYDETGYQQEVSDHLHTKHTPFYCTNQDIAEYFKEVVWHTEVPLIRTAPVPMYHLSKKVREKGIKVVITGEGADEMLAGYNIFKEALIREFWSREPKSKYRPLLLSRLYPYIANLQGKNPNIMKLFFGYKLNETDSPYYSHMLRWKNTSSIQNFLSKPLLQSLIGYDSYQELEQFASSALKNRSLLSRAQWLETSIFMSGYLLHGQGDRVGMANSIEGRYPFLDHRMLEFAASLPEKFKLNGLNEKYILKELMHNKLPDSVVKRSKQAYRAPIYNSFISENTPEYIRAILSETKLNSMGIFNTQPVQKLVDKIQTQQSASEIENMSLAFIISTMLLQKYFIQDIPKLNADNMNDCRIIRET